MAARKNAHASGDGVVNVLDVVRTVDTAGGRIWRTARALIEGRHDALAQRGGGGGPSGVPYAGGVGPEHA